jgi:hypothetical protein
MLREVGPIPAHLPSPHADPALTSPTHRPSPPRPNPGPGSQPNLTPSLPSCPATDYWGEHIHLGYYNDEERRRGYKKKNFIQAKYDFVEEMLKWSGAAEPKKILDVGCGIGGTSRYLANKFRDASVTGEAGGRAAGTRARSFAPARGVM